MRGRGAVTNIAEGDPTGAQLHHLGWGAKVRMEGWKGGESKASRFLVKGTVCVSLRTQPPVRRETGRRKEKNLPLGGNFWRVRVDSSVKSFAIIRVLYCLIPYVRNNCFLYCWLAWSIVQTLALIIISVGTRIGEAMS